MFHATLIGLARWGARKDRMCLAASHEFPSDTKSSSINKKKINWLYGTASKDALAVPRERVMASKPA